MSLYLFFILPLLVSGLVHHLVIIKYNLLPTLARPISLTLFGPTKTYRGLVVMVILSSIAAEFISKFLPISELRISALLAGAVAGLGYSLGELPTSFFKRRTGIPASRQGTGVKGALFYFLEQGDSVFGALICVNFLADLTIIQNLAIFVSGFLLHVIVDSLLYFAGYKKTLPLPAFLKKLLGRKDYLKLG